MLLQDTSLTVSALAAVVLPVGIVVVVLACMQCFRKKPSGFSVPAAPAPEEEKNFGNSTHSVNASQAHVNTTFSIDIEDTSVDAPNSTAVNIEPLPDIASKSKLPTVPLRPRIGCLEKARQDASLKLITVHHPFPRNQIVYLKELGSGWFGKVIESDAEKITTGIARSKVVVKMLKDDANKDEQQLFFEEVAPFRELEHTNVVRLLGQCTEMHPMLMILEAAAFGNLKQYLRSHRQQQASLIQKNRLMQFAINASCGLACLHRHDYLHRDLAARNCLVMSDHTLKIGDYGIAEDLFKEDYFTCGSHLLPIRWMAPETLKQENGTWSAHNFSKESDIWSLGVVLWEIAMLGERPYDMLTDEAVLQGVIVDKDIRLPLPDIALPNKDRLYEVMRFCWLEQSQRTKVDEVYSLLQQVASKVPEEGAPKDAISAFEEKWEHLMPNQRHMSVDSTDERLGSFSSEDSDLLKDLSQPDSLEDLTAPEMKLQTPQAPPRVSRKKVSAAAVSIPQADTTTEAPAAAANKKVEEPVAIPQINISVVEETRENAPQAQQAQIPQQKEEPKEAVEAIPQRASETEFTDFTSYDVSEKPPEETSDMSQDISEVFTSPDASAGLPQAKEAGNAMEDIIQIGAGDALSNIQTRIEESFVVTTPDRPVPKIRKTSTPIAKDESSPSSSSSFSTGDSSSATFLTAQTSSPGNLTDAYATASDSTIVTDQTKMNVTETSDFSGFEQLPSITGDSSLSFEILDTTAVPSVFDDFDKSAEESQSTPVSNNIAASTTTRQNPFTEASLSVHKDDSFGEFTNASEMDQTAEVSPHAPSKPSPSADLATSGFDASTTDFFSFNSETSMTVSQTQSSKMFSGVEVSASENKAAAQDPDPLASFGTDLSSLSSLNMPAASADVDQEQAFPSFSTEFSSFNSMGTDAAATPQAEPQSNPFALDQVTQVTKSEDAAAPTNELQDNSSGINGDFSFDMLSSLPDVASNTPVTDSKEVVAENETSKQNNQQIPDLFGDLTPVNPPVENKEASNPFAGISSEAPADSGGQSGTQQLLTDLFSVGGSVSQGTSSGNQDNGLETLDSKGSSSAPEPSSTVSEFDLLSGFSDPAPAANPQSSSSNLFSEEGGLLQEFTGASLATPPSSALKVGNGLENAGASFSGEAESSATSTDTDSTSNSDSSKDYICEEPWGEAEASSPPPGSPASSVDSEDYALQIASEIYLSKGLKMARPYEMSVLEPIPEDPLPSISEESGAPTPSETSSVDVRFEDVFEWDDFMGEPLVGKERTSSDPESPKQSFEMPDWTLDVDSESVRSGNSLHSQRSDDLNKGSAGSDSLSTGSADTPNARSSVSDSEVTLHGRGVRTHRSYISDLLANRTKGLTLNTSTPARTSLNQNKFYSLYEEDFDLDSDSQSEGSCSPPVPNPTSESQSPPTLSGVSALHAELQPPYTSAHEVGEDSAPTNTQDSLDDVLVANGSGGPEQSPDTSLFDFSAFESASTTPSMPAAGDGATSESKSTSETNGAPSLIDF